MVLALAGDSTMTRCLPLRTAALAVVADRAPATSVAAVADVVLAAFAVRLGMTTAAAPPADADPLAEDFPLVFGISVVALSGCKSDRDHGPARPLANCPARR